MLPPLWNQPSASAGIAYRKPLVALTQTDSASLSSSPPPPGFRVVDSVDGSIAPVAGPNLVRSRLEANQVRLVLIRHGQAQSNADSEKLGEPLLYGQSESPLTDKGVAQARECAQTLYTQLGGDGWMQQCLAQPQKLPVFLSSTLGRATQTAQILSQFLKDRLQAIGGEAALARLGPDLDVHPDPRLLESNFGSFEKRPLSELKKAYPDFVEHWRPSQGMGTDFLQRFPGGESRADTMTRVGQLLDGVSQRYPGRTVICLTHGEAALATRTVLGLAPVEGGKVLAETGAIDNAKPYFLVGKPSP